jgi:hypothetical protein
MSLNVSAAKRLRSKHGSCSAGQFLFKFYIFAAWEPAAKKHTIIIGKFRSSTPFINGSIRKNCGFLGIKFTATVFCGGKFQLLFFVTLFIAIVSSHHLMAVNVTSGLLENQPFRIIKAVTFLLVQ